MREKWVEGEKMLTGRELERNGLDDLDGGGDESRGCQTLCVRLLVHFLGPLSSCTAGGQF